MIWWLLFLTLGVALAYLRVPLQTAASAFGLALIAYALFGGSWGWFFPLLLLWAAVFGPLLVPALRQEWITRHLLGHFRRVLPVISDTERVALEAGTVWWEGELFRGVPDWHRLHQLPAPALSAEEQAFLDGPVEQLCRMCDDWRITTLERDLPPQAWAFLKEQRFFGMVIPREFGGLGFSATAHSAVLMKVASSPGGITAASTVAVPNSLGPGELLLHYGTDAQKQHYLPRLARGEEIPCFALTSPWAGSDAASIPDTGVVCRGQWQGREVLGLRLTFDKRYITLAPVATLVGLAFRLEDPDGLLGEQGRSGISCALIPRDTPGLEIGARHWPLDNPFMNGPVRGQDLFVPLDCLIGGAALAGQGWRMLMECLAVGRSISLPANSTGQAVMAALATGAYARVRRQFGVPIGQFEMVQSALAAIGGQAYAGQAVRQFTALAVDQGEKPAVASAIAKATCTDLARDVLTRAMDVHAGKAVMLGPSNYLARAWQGNPVAITVEGANLLTRGLILFGQGAMRGHPYVLKEIEAVRQENAAAALEQFDALLWPHVGHVLTAAARALVLGLTFGRLANTPPSGVARRHFQQASRYAAAFALLTDLAMATLGGALKQREAISARLGEVLARLYLVSAVLKRFEQEGRPAEDRPLLDWACTDAFQRIEQALDGVLANLPLRPAAWLARLLVFPLGRHARAPDDATERRVAELLQHPGPARTRLGAGAFRGDGESALGRLEQALALATGVEDLELAVARAARAGRLRQVHPLARILEARDAGVLDADAAQRLYDATVAAEQACRVDEFTFEQMGAAAAEPPRTRRQGTG